MKIPFEVRNLIFEFRRLLRVGTINIIGDKAMVPRAALFKLCRYKLLELVEEASRFCVMLGSDGDLNRDDMAVCTGDDIEGGNYLGCLKTKDGTVDEKIAMFERV